MQSEKRLEYTPLLQSIIIFIAGICIGGALVLAVTFPSPLLSNKVFYEIPSGGYIYVDGDYLRYNQEEFDGKLDYQITLNYESVK